MSETVYGLYENFEDAATVVHAFTNRGYNVARLSMIVNNKDGRFDHYTTEVTTEEMDDGNAAGFGAVVGTLTALGTSLIPGIGPVLAAGPAAAALAAGIGAATGAVTGAAVAEALEIELDEDEAKEYARILKEGGAILVAEEYEGWDDDRIEAVMEEHNPERVDDTD